MTKPVFATEKSNIERLKEILYGHVTQEEIVFSMEKLIKKHKADIKKCASEEEKEKKYEELVTALESMINELK